MKNKILIIDDELQIRDLLGDVLISKGYVVNAVSSGVEAKRQILEQHPDLIICDLQMEDTDGFFLIQQLKEQLPDVPVILLTGVIFDPQTVENLGQKQISVYLPKTAPLQKLLEEVNRLLSS
jgi:CheY-like chemotaxis protein